MKRRKTDANVEEKVMAVYATCLNCSEVARRLKMSRKTVHDIVKRRSGDNVEELRASFRRDLAQEAWEGIEALLPFVKGAELGSERASRGSEAARAAHDLARVASLLDGRDKVDPNLMPAQTIVVNTALPTVPPEIGKAMLEDALAQLPASYRATAEEQIAKGGITEAEAAHILVDYLAKRKAATSGLTVSAAQDSTLPGAKP